MTFLRQNAFPTNHVTVLQAVVTRLQASVPMLSAGNSCFFSLHPTALPEERQNIYAVVTPRDGEFDIAVYGGSGIAGICERSGVSVTVFSQMDLDRADADIQMLTDASRGLLILKSQILKVLSACDLVDGSGNRILLDAMRPLASRQVYRNGLGSFSLDFSTDFIWDLS